MITEGKLTLKIVTTEKTLYNVQTGTSEVILH